ncbi:hypothetical protein HG530_006834 [Fusarium avenaceum]|nr:hypothetical protein HG530_006834 [Fusarium avenaceum]
MDSSIARKGPKSLPLALTTPTTAAKSKTQKFSNVQNIAPETAIKSPPATRTRRRPSPSAMSVTTNPRTTSPSSVKLMNKPMRKSEKPSSEKNWAIVSVTALKANMRHVRERISSQASLPA